MNENYQIMLSKKEYDRITELANANQELINQKAREMWEKEGKVMIEIGMKLESDRRNNIDSYDTYHFDSYSLMWTSGKFYIPERLKEKLRTMIAHQTKSLMEKSFGENLLHINNVINLERRRERQIKRYSIFALTGWIVGSLVIAIAALL